MRLLQFASQHCCSSESCDYGSQSYQCCSRDDTCMMCQETLAELKQCNASAHYDDRDLLGVTSSRLKVWGLGFRERVGPFGPFFELSTLPPFPALCPWSFLNHAQLQVCLHRVMLQSAAYFVTTRSSGFPFDSFCATKARQPSAKMHTNIHQNLAAIKQPFLSFLHKPSQTCT